MPKRNNNPSGEQLWKMKLEKNRLRNLKHQKNIGAPVQPMGTSGRPAKGGGEGAWANQLEQVRLRNAMTFGGTALPGPGAAGAAAVKAPAIGSPLKMRPSGGKPGGKKPGGIKGAVSNPQAPSSIETAKVAAQLASGVGIGKLAAEETKQALMAAGKGALATAGAVWQIINKWGPWALFFGFFSIICEDPFLTAPAILLVLWIWVTCAHWLKVKWLRQFNVLEILALIVCSAVYAVVFAMIVIILALVACALDTSCATEAISSLGISDALGMLGM